RSRLEDQVFGTPVLNGDEEHRVGAEQIEKALGRQLVHVAGFTQAEIFEQRIGEVDRKDVVAALGERARERSRDDRRCIELGGVVEYRYDQDRLRFVSKKGAVVVLLYDTSGQAGAEHHRY